MTKIRITGLTALYRLIEESDIRRGLKIRCARCGAAYYPDPDRVHACPDVIDVQATDICPQLPAGTEES